LTMWNKTLDPKSPDFKYSDAVVVASSDGIEDNDSIDPSLLLDPTDGKLWLSYGTYFGYIRLVELDPKTGRRVEGNKALNIAIDCEASDLIYRDGWYYLLGTHGTCCDGPNSTYNIVVGRSRKVTGPYLDNIGREMLKGGGKMVVEAGDRLIGPGHFGRTILGEGVEIMSCHYESDLDQSGRSVLGIRPLLWKNGWPVAGDNFKAGTYEIESERRGYALQIDVDFARMTGVARGFNRNSDEPIKPIPSQELTDVIKAWPTGDIGLRIGDYMFRPHQKWTITPVPGAGGYLGGPYYKIVIAGTDRALAATTAAELTTVPIFTGAPEQLWRIDQSTEGTYRIMPKVIPGSNEKFALVSSGDSTPTLAKYDMNSDNSKWNFKAH
jgi:arabinan endo-1,5-alpha-L-arabinosidase